MVSRSRLWLIVCFNLTIAPMPAVADDTKIILVIHTYGHDAPGRFVLDAAFARTLRAATGITTELYIESLDPNRFRGEAQYRSTAAHLRDRYASKQIAVVVAVYGPALDFVLAKDTPFPGVPVVAALTRQPEAAPPGVAFTFSGDEIGATLIAATRLQPGARQIAVIDGTVRTSPDVLGGEIRRQVEAARGHRSVGYLQDLPLDELLPRVRALAPDTIILVVRQFLGPRGTPIAQPEAIRQLAEAAPAPVYVVTDQLVGSGAVGGMVLNVDHVGAHLARLALRVAETGSADLPPAPEPPVPTFDWRALQRWGIDEARLPQGSVVLFREYTFWDLYRWYVTVAIAIVAIQSALIVGLIVQGRRRRQTEHELRGREQQLRHSSDQNRDLAGRLINAQEEERARIARDLHDDLSQQLASVSIMLSDLKRKAAQPGSGLEVEQAINKIQGRAATAASAVRTLSHELHPGVLEHVGVVSALRRHCAETEANHRVKVLFRAQGEEDLQTLKPDVALCLFRVTQEALTNAVRHARAGAVRVELMWTPDATDLRIIDDGIGFVPAEHARSGLGLRSVDERVRLSHGALSLESVIGRGTTLSVRIPHPAPASNNLSVQSVSGPFR